MESPTTPLREPLLPQALHTPQGIRFIVPGSLSEPYAARTTSEEDSSSFSDAPIWTWANAPLLLGSLALAFFTANLGPFLPNELAKLGQSSAIVGVAFAAYPAFVMVGSPLAAVACAACGQAPVLYVGMVVEGGLAIVSGYFTRLASTGGGCMAVYCVLRALQGLGGAASYTAISARLADRFPDRLGTVMGLQESFAGAGYTLGPPLGALLYKLGGFPAPFVVMGMALLATLPLMPAAMRVKAAPDESSRSPSPFSSTTPSPSPLRRGWRAEVEAAACDGSVAIGTLVTVVSGVGIGFVIPTLEQHLQELLGADEMCVGLLFGLIAAAYVAASTVGGYLSDRLGHRPVMATGLGILAVCYMLLGPAPWLTATLPPLQPHAPHGQPARWALWATQLMALAGIGVGVGFTLVPSMPHMLHGLRAASVSNPSEAAAGLFNFAYNAGECLGPLLGGVLTAALGFQMASAVVATATAMLLMAVLLVPSHPPANRLFGYSGSDSWPAAERDRAG